MLPAVDCIQRGFASLRANWELVLVQVARSLLVGLLVVAGLAAPIAVTGGDPVALATPWRWFEAGDGGGGIEAWIGVLAGDGRALVLASAATAVAWLTAFIAYCALQAGTFGVLVAGDRQAPQGALRPPDWFRTYSTRDFLGWAGRYLWRFVAFACIALVLSLAALLATFAWLAGVAWAGGRWGGGAILGVGCGGLLPIAFGWLLLWLWLQLAQASLADGSGVRGALRSAGGVLGRRTGGVFLVVFVFAVGFVALSVAFAPLRLGLELALGDLRAVAWAAGTLLGTAQAVATGTLAVALGASLVAMVRGSAPEAV